MKLWTLNKWLRRFGLVLVFSEDLETGEHEFSLERLKKYQTRPAEFEPVIPWLVRLPNIRAYMGVPDSKPLSEKEVHDILESAFGRRTVRGDNHAR